MREIDIVIVGGGSAGMSAAIAAKEQGCDRILILERDQELGGILEQCIHNGFGLQIFHEELSGPAYAEKLKNKVKEYGIAYQLNTTVVEIKDDRTLFYVNEQEGFVGIKAKAIILAVGCYERNRGAIHIPGTRVKGIYTAGTAQRYLNMENIMVGKRVFILGSGDIGLIMARRMRLEGAEVLGVAELMPYSNGLTRNIVQCLHDFAIPLYLSHTIVDIQGKDKLEAIRIAQVDAYGKPIPNTEKSFEVDTLLLSVGLIPENSLGIGARMEIDAKTKGAIVNERYETSISHIYACGNALHVHDLVDFVSLEAQHAARCVCEDLNASSDQDVVHCLPQGEVSYVIPQQIHKNFKDEKIMFSFRVKKPCKNAIIEFSNQKGICKSIRKKVLLPAEMERIELASELLQGSEVYYVKVREDHEN